MKAVVHQRFGGPEVLAVAELPEPKMNVDQVVVSVRAAGLNPADLAVRAGALRDVVETYFPVVPGWDIAGVVERAGIAAPEFAPGDEVIGYLRGPVAHRNGGYAAKTVAEVGMLARKPATMSWAEAAGLPLAGLTALQAVRALDLRAGETLLVHAAAGGVGSLAVQLAAARGVRVIGTASAANHDYVRSLGAEPVRYGDGLGERVSAIGDVSAVLDAAGRGALATAPGLGSRAVTIADRADQGVQQVFARLDTADLEYLVAEADAGRLSVRVARTFPLEEAARAQQALAGGGVSGKVVLLP
ncbi:NADP-dependent oxidoreductase [Amycolatopsis sp. NPDC005232]|uniref:NADP-dependent oxidoreductase n=1 Tax=Amycolatopsis sp. NPDC005232 TaxID=3157027 RepID=UPI0033BDE75D